MFKRRNRVEDLEPIIPDEENVKGKYGVPKTYDPTFQGPIKRRSCTDIICCIFFLACIGGLFFVAFLAWTSGDPSSLLHPTDYKGQVCGRDKAVKDKPILFFYDYTACADVTSLLEFSCGTPQLCVSECPDYTYFPYALTAVPSPAGILIDWSRLICDYGFDPEEEHDSGDYQGSGGLAKIFEDEKCAGYYLPQMEYGKRCVPTFLVLAAESFENGLSGENVIIVESSNTSVLPPDAIPVTDQPISPFGDQDITSLENTLASVLNVFMGLQNIFEVIYEDLVASWPVILVGLFVGMVLAMLYIILMRWIAGVLVWFTVFLLNGLLAAATGYSFYYWKSLEGVEGAEGEFKLTTNVIALLRARSTWLVLGCVFGALTVILLLVTLCLCNRIRIAVALIKEASRAVSCMMSTLFWPVIPFFLEVIVVCLWMAIAAYLATSHTATYLMYYHNGTQMISNGTECSKEDVNDTDGEFGLHCQFASYALPNYFIYLQFFNLFMLFWLINFVIALGQMTLAGAFASYYWAFTKPRDIPNIPVFRSLGRSLRYHLGSLAFGSLIIAIIQIIRVILEYVEKKLKSKANNKVVSYIIKCLKCFFWLLEKVMKIINKNAFIMIAIYGKNFCTSAREAFFLLMRNIVRVAVVNKLTDFILLLGKLSVSILVGVIAYFFFTGKIPYLNGEQLVPSITYHWTPILIICIGTYAIAWCFFSVYDMAVDTLFLCFLEDLERHDGSAEKPYYMSRELQKIIGQKNIAE